MTDAVLRERLLATVPALDDADWLEVCRRARALGAPRRRNRRLLAIAAVLAVLTALVVNPALGIGERLLGFVEGEPAPESIKVELRAGATRPPLRVGDRVIERPTLPPPDLVGAHLAIALDSSVGPIYLWAAPMEGGGACTALQLAAQRPRPDGRPNVSSACGSGPTAERRIHAGGSQTAFEGRPLALIQGRVHPSIARLEVELSDGRVVPLRLVERFFLAELPWVRPSERGADCGPEAASPISPRPEPAAPPVRCPLRHVEYRGYDANGRLLERSKVPTLVPPRRVEAFREATSIRLFSGREARLEYARAERGQLCWRLTWASATGGGCSVVPKRTLPSMMGSGVGRNQLLLLHGPVGADIESVELVYDDASRERLTIENGFVLKQLDPYGVLPARIVGRDSAGRVVADRSAWGPG